VIIENRNTRAVEAWMRKYFVIASFVEGCPIKNGITRINKPSIVNQITRTE